MRSNRKFSHLGLYLTTGCLCDEEIRPVHKESDPFMCRCIIIICINIMSAQTECLATNIWLLYGGYEVEDWQGIMSWAWLYHICRTVRDKIKIFAEMCSHVKNMRRLRNHHPNLNPCHATSVFMNVLWTGNNSALLLTHRRTKRDGN